jgi:23S rRNA (cytosine1962-C5)-methyltransferase
VLRRATGVWLDQGALEPDAHPVVLEHGVRFSIDPGLGEPERPRPGIGLFLDQRENRRRVAGMVSGGRYLNLFAHTGAFSAALLRAGAEHVTSVDLSAPYLAWTERNLRLNDLDGERHHAVRGDARRHLAECPREARFAGIILDPPTAAAAGRRFFSVKRDLLPMLEEALARIESGGWLLVSRNDRARRGDLVEVVRRAARARGVRLADVSRAPAGPDFPQLRGFPEGDPMQAVLARVR